ncbi:copper resistance protein CopC [uncultured Roseobacter sp.]|uniref:copper resistance CopC family protein n=1 Tax=uncultured Roseobacter sp. TaxID=114847 RepID=UPI00260BE0CF|nr:copper resistance protein CopC [uncultured Roseobacter sp.]
MIRALIASLMLALTATLAFAHSENQGTTPADGATVTEVPELSMRFDDPMLIITVTLTSPDGTVDIERETGMEPGLEFRAAPATPLAPGNYTFGWRGMASDGHPMQGSFSFTVTD